MADKKEVFKLLIKEFAEYSFPVIFDRDLKIPTSSSKIITVYGPRRSGKSYYFLKQIQRLEIKTKVPRSRLLYLNFDDDRLWRLSLPDLDILLEAYFEIYPENKKEQLYFFFDELQNIEGWEMFARRIYDKEKIRVFITGSSSKLLGREIATALRGRTVSFHLTPLNFREFLRFKKIDWGTDYEFSSIRFQIKKELEEYLEWGGFPEIALTDDKNLKRKILKEYFDSLLYRDLAERFSLENVALLKDILINFTTNFTKLFSLNGYNKNISQNMAVSRVTVGEYVERIKETEYFFLLSNFSYSLKQQRVNPKKILCVDNGLRNCVAFRLSPDWGKLAENAVGNSLSSLAENTEIFYWQKKYEVDFVIKAGNSLKAVNVCWDNEFNEREKRSLLEFSALFKGRKKLILLTKDIEKEENGIEFIPLHKWFLSL